MCSSDLKPKRAASLGLDFLPPENWLSRPSVAGTLRGRTVQIFNYVTGGGKSSTTWSAVKAELSAPGLLTVALKRQGFATKVAELFGAHEITVDDAEFDRAWFVQTNQPEFLRAALIPELRAKLMAVLRAGMSGEFQLKGREVKYAETGTFADLKRAERFALVAEIVCDLAEVGEVAAERRGTA